MKLKLLICLLLALLLPACNVGFGAQNSFSTPSISSDISALASSSVSSALSEEEPVLIYRNNDILKQLNATQLEQVRYLDENTAYIFAFYFDDNVDLGTGKGEGILARYKIDSNEVKVLHRQRMSIDAGQELKVEAVADGSVVVFNGWGVYSVFEDDTVEYTELEERFRETPFLDIQNKRLAYADKIFDRNTGETIILYPSIFKEYEGGRGYSSEGAFLPKISPNGERVMFQHVFGGGMGFKRIICTDLKGKQIFKTEEIERISSELHMGWLQDKINTVQNRDTHSNADDDYSSLFTLYDEAGKLEKRFEISTPIGLMQQTPNNSSNKVSFYFNDYQIKKWDCSLGIVDFDTGSAKEVYRSPNIIVSHDLSPSGEKLIWLEQNALCELELANAKPSDIPIIKEVS